MAPDPGGVTMVLPEAQEQEKGGTVLDDAQPQLSAVARGNDEEQIGPSEADEQTDSGQHGLRPNSGTEPTLDEDVSIWIQTNPSGLEIGIDSFPLQVAPANFVLQNGSIHMLYTVSPQLPNWTDTRYRFDRWIDGPATLGWNVTINGSQTYIASFITQYLITIDSNIHGPILMGSDMPGCDVPMLAPIHCWVDVNSSPILIVNSPQQFDGSKFTFVQWSDGDLRTVRPISPVTGPATYIAMFIAEYLLILQDTCTGNPPISSWEDAGTAVELIWNPPSLPPRERYRFVMWMGEGNGSYTGILPTVSIIMNGPINETALCYHEFLITVDTSPTGIAFNVDDVTCTGPKSFWWANQSMHWLNLTVLEFQVSPSVKYSFTHWSDGNASPSRLVRIDAPEDYIAFYDITQYKLTLSPLIIGDIRCIEHVDCWYESGETATAQVTSPWFDGSGARYDFAQWSGDASGTDTSATLRMDAPKTAIAEWGVSFHLTVTSPYGNPQCSNADCWYLNGTDAIVTLENPFPTGMGTRQVFTGWSGDASGVSLPLAITMTGQKTVEASWVQQFLLTVKSDCDGGTDCHQLVGTVWYDDGSVATLIVEETFTDSSGTVWDFSGWTGDIAGEDLDIVMIMDSPKTVTSNWMARMPTERPSALPAFAIATALILAAVLLSFWHYRRIKLHSKSELNQSSENRRKENEK